MKLYYYKGEGLSLKQISAKYNIDYNLLRSRIKEKWPLTLAINTPKQNISNHTFNGETKTLKEWAKDVRINYYTLRHRIYEYNWSIERALTEPVHTEFRKNNLSTRIRSSNIST
jgi:hypothetical protein